MPTPPSPSPGVEAAQGDLDESFAWRVERTVTQSLTAQYDRVMFILEPNDITRALPSKKVTIYDFRDGRIEVRHQGLALPYRTFDRITRVDQGAIVENKRLSEALEMCRAMTAHSENKDEADRSVRRRGVRALRDGRAPRPPAAPTPSVCVISNGDRKCLL